MKEKIKKIIPLIIIVILIGGIFWFFSQRETAQGKVVDIVTDEPLIDVDVMLDDKNIKTNEEGCFTLTSLKKMEEISVNVPEGYEEIGPVDISTEPLVIKLTPTLEETNNRIDLAKREKDFDTVWLYLHPDDQEVWEKEEYFKKLEEYPPSTKKTELSTEELGEWKNPFRNKSYQNVTVMWPKEVEEDLLMKSLLSIYWQKIDGYWHFFTEFLSSKEKEKILTEAKESRLTIEEVKKKVSESIGKTIAWPGEIITISEEEGKTLILLFEIPSYNTFVTLFEGTTEAFEGDSVFIYGLMEDFTSYESQAGWHISVPVIRAVEIEEL